MDAISERLLINATWLIKLRWVAVIGQVLTILVTILLFRIQLPTVWSLATAISVTAGSNLALMYRFSGKAQQSNQKLSLIHI